MVKPSFIGASGGRTASSLKNPTARVKAGAGKAKAAANKLKAAQKKAAKKK